jgi:diguanylate cyclase (GGDEF)-like protein/PAS domain S-box-containing protein
MQSFDVQRTRECVAFEAATDGAVWVDATGRILMANSAMGVLTGYGATELIDQNMDMFLHENQRARFAISMRRYFAGLTSGSTSPIASKLMRRDGHMLPVEISLGIYGEGEEWRAVAFVRDLTERKEFEEALKFNFNHDPLTGLPNRRLFLLQLNYSLAHAKTVNSKVAVLFLDLDHFKKVNESFGHATGDALLIQVGARIRSHLRQGDVLARLGGDEFGILLTNLIGDDEAVSVATMVLATLQTSYRLRHQDVYSGGSLGLAFYPKDAQDSDTLLRYADIALYQAKQAGRGVHACYATEMDRLVHEDMQLHTRLKETLLSGMLQLHYQPQVGVESGEIVGAEALLRWNDPVLGNVSPTRFIPVAEATGLILPLSDWVLEAACKQIAAWTAAGTPLRVAINISAQQFRQRDLPMKVRGALSRTGALPEWLEIEITESAAMTHPEQASEQLNALVALGCRVALDDFGTGYSSLAYLKDLPVCKLKIDKSFMDGIPDDVGDATISRAIIALAHSLGMTIVAEGVETDAQLSFLHLNNCEIYQGWLFAKAMPAEELTTLLRTTHNLPA